MKYEYGDMWKNTIVLIASTAAQFTYICPSKSDQVGLKQLIVVKIRVIVLVGNVSIVSCHQDPPNDMSPRHVCMLGTCWQTDQHVAKICCPDCPVDMSAKQLANMPDDSFRHKEYKPKHRRKLHHSGAIWCKKVPKMVLHALIHACVPSFP